jgi:hypothetical protein
MPEGTGIERRPAKQIRLELATKIADKDGPGCARGIADHLRPVRGSVPLIHSYECLPASKLLSRGETLGRCLIKKYIHWVRCMSFVALSDVNAAQADK